MKKAYIVTVTCCLVAILVAFIYQMLSVRFAAEEKVTRIGVIYVGDESTPYTMNFIKAQKAVINQFGDRVEIISQENVPEGQETDALNKLINEGCELIFTGSYGYGPAVKAMAMEHPDIQFCAATCDNAMTEPLLSNYHTFMGHIYEGRYACGVVAGLKMKEMIDNGELSPENAKIGYVAAFPYAEVISGYTAFYLGAQSVVPECTMYVKYSGSWSDYSEERKIAEEMIDLDCVIISQHSDTIGPAVACENARKNKKVYHVGYNQSMIDVAPTSSLVSCRIDWSPYYIGAVQAVLDGKSIEKSVEGSINGCDAGGGMKEGWVEILDLNSNCVAEGSEEIIYALVKQIEAGKVSVFSGNFTGVNPFDENDTYDLNVPYVENRNSSAPSFNYVLKDVITVLE